MLRLLKSIVLSTAFISPAYVSAETVKLYGPGMVPSSEVIDAVLGDPSANNSPKKSNNRLGKRKGWNDAANNNEDDISGTAESTLAKLSTSTVTTRSLEPTNEESTKQDVKSLGLQIVFALNSHSIDKASFPVLDALAQSLSKHSTTILMEGHTDATGSQDHNLALSVKRAEAVKSYLVQRGIAASRMVTTGAASTKPLNKADPTAAENRRVEFTRLN